MTLRNIKKNEKHKTIIFSSSDVSFNELKKKDKLQFTSTRNQTILTSNMFLRFTSHKFRQPISVDMYHPLNEVAENCIPPQSKSILLTAGNAYHLRLSSLNHSNLKIRIEHIFKWGWETTYFGWINGTSKTNSGGYSKKSGSLPFAERTKGSMSHSVRLPFHPSFSHTCRIELYIRFGNCF